MAKFLSFLLLASAPLVSSLNINRAPLGDDNLEERQSCSYWMEDIAPQGVAAFNPTTNYTVFRNVMEYGAVGDGITDDSDAINNAISDQGRFGPSSGQSSTTTAAVVYFPAGTYLITKPINDYFFTQLIGNPNCLPTIKANTSFTGDYLMEGDQNNGYASVNIFFRQMRNFIMDTTLVDPATAITAIHWNVGQATSLQNIVINMSPATNTNHVGVFSQDGSGGFLSGITFNGGSIGLKFGNQQFTMRDLNFQNVKTAIQMGFDWGWTYKDLTINNCGVGIDMSAGGTGNVLTGGLQLIDSTITNTQTGVLTARTTSSNPPAAGGLVLENVRVRNVGKTVAGPGGVTRLAGQGNSFRTVQAYAEGHAYNNGPLSIVQGPITPNPRPASLLSGGKYYTITKPQYETLPASSFVSARTVGAKGNGLADDTQKLQQAINQALAQNKVLYVNAGTYKVTNTITIPAGSRIVGESYSVIMGSGKNFADVTKPKPVVLVGKPGDTGRIEWSDMIVSTQGGPATGQAGAILIRWNLASTATAPSGMWDVHTRIGGFTGSKFTETQCPVQNSTITNVNQIDKKCMSAFMSMHVTTSASGLYMENNWLWTADHDIDDAASTTLVRETIYSGRGLLVESTVGNIWMYGTAVEHHVKYQYQFQNTKNIFISQAQTETPYYQPNPNATIPFPRNTVFNDPVFPSTTYTSPDGVTAPNANAFGFRALNTKSLMVYGAGFYSFFNNYDDGPCNKVANGVNCQSRILDIKNSTVYVYDLHTVGTNQMASENGADIVYYKDNIGGFQQNVILLRT